MRAPELEPNSGWINSARPLSIHGDLAGHVVLLEFWTPGRIANRHATGDLAWLLKKFGGEPFHVVGVCCTETREEQTVEQVRHDVARRGVGHPVVIDDHFRIWRAYRVAQWPTYVLIDPRGEIVGQVGGEGNRMLLDRYIARLLADHRLDRTLAGARLQIDPGGAAGHGSELRYPGGVLAIPPRVGAPGRLFVADSLNHRVIATGWPDESGRAETAGVYGGSAPGFADGPGGEAAFNGPRGLSYDPGGDVLYVADVDNHAVRQIELKTGFVRTTAGTGRLGEVTRGGAVGVRQPLRSPWGIAFDGRRRRLMVAMAGDHRVWAVDLTTMVTRAVAGTGVDRVADGRAEEAMFSQPSGLVLSSDGETVFVVDSAGSALRAIDVGDDRVRTIIGHVPGREQADNVLSEAGDRDGAFPEARLRHPLGLTLWATSPLHASGDRLLVADTRNNSIRLIDPFARTAETWPVEGLTGPGAVSMATPRLGESARPVLFVADTDGHRVVRVDPETFETTGIEFDR